MGCDYYIDTFLCIYCNSDTKPINLDLNHQKGYFFFPDDLIEEEYKKEKKAIFESEIKPIIIYSNNDFSNSDYKDMYIHLINYKIMGFGKCWDDIKTITKNTDKYKS
jgi:hypothetical protein